MLNRFRSRKLKDQLKDELKDEQKDAFHYQELPSKTHFRLLRLVSKKEGLLIACFLKSFDIDSPECPEYRAVSYEWGTDKRSVSIRMWNSGARSEGEKKFWIRENLMEIVQDLRHPEHDCWLWIDAICINQSSTQERNDQVRLMGKIYSKANIVVAWLTSDHLGPNGPLIRDSRCVNSVFFQNSHGHNSLFLRASLGDIEAGFPSYLSIFCNLPYWTRKWIIQEVVAARTVVLRCGLAAFPMKDVEDFFQRLVAVQPPYLPELHSSPAALLALHRLGKRTGENYPLYLHDLLHRYKAHKCGEPSDHVYALFNMIGDHREHLVIDYAQTPVDRYLSILNFMQEHEDLSPRKALCTAELLNNVLRISDNTNVKLTKQEKERLELTKTVVTAFDRGKAFPQEESQATLAYRDRVDALLPMPRLSLHKLGSQWIAETHMTYASDSDGHFQVNPWDLMAFEIPTARVFGLAETRLQACDRIWQFQQTNYAFIVRMSSDSLATIIGRAYLFDQNIDATIHCWEGPRTLKLTPKDLDSPDAGLEEFDIVLKSTNLIQLASWAI